MSPVKTDSVTFRATERGADVSGLLLRPGDAKALYVLAHGAGAGMRHAFMEETATRLADNAVATFRYQFPYIENGRRRPDPPAVLHDTVRAAVERARGLAPDLPMVAGGKSMGGRMTSAAQAKETLEGVRGLVFLGFPLHAPGKHDASRADHLDRVDIPMLFVQGTRDNLADLELMRPVCERLDERATLHVVEGGDHSFKVLKRSGRSHDDVMAEIVAAVGAWIRRVIA